MNSIYQLALGNDFAKLHPRIQERFSLHSQSQRAVIGTGVMDKVWHGGWFARPFLRFGTRRNIMFPETGQKIPFTIENYPYRDSFGRETITWTRTFQFPRRARRFDATMIYSPSRSRIIDYLGTHQHLAVDIQMSVDEKTGGIRLQSGRQRFYESIFGFRFPMCLSGYADVCEWFDEEFGRFRITVSVTNPRVGKLFGYSGSFSVQYTDFEQVPHHVKPRREERRD